VEFANGLAHFVATFVEHFVDSIFGDFDKVAD